MQFVRILLLLALLALVFSQSVSAQEADAFEGETAEILDFTFKGDYYRVREILKENPASVEVENDWGWNAVRFAVEFGHQAILRELLEAGADPNVPDNRTGDTPLHVALRNEDRNIAYELILGGADPTIANNDNETPSSIVRASQRPVLRLLIAEAIATHAITTGDLSAIRQALQDGAWVNVHNGRGHTALFAAIGANDIDFTKDLLKQGAYVNVGDFDGWTPLHHAAHNGNTEIVDLLLKNGALADAANQDGISPAGIAAEQGYPELEAMIAAAIDSSAGDL